VNKDILINNGNIGDFPHFYTLEKKIGGIGDVGRLLRLLKQEWAPAVGLRS